MRRLALFFALALAACSPYTSGSPTSGGGVPPSGATTITTLGTVTTGTWNGTDIAASYLADTAVTPGSYTAANITVDQQGRITAAASGSGATSTWLETQLALCATKAGITTAQMGYIYEEFTDAARWHIEVIASGATTPTWNSTGNGSTAKFSTTAANSSQSNMFWGVSAANAGRIIASGAATKYCIAWRGAISNGVTTGAVAGVGLCNGNTAAGVANTGTRQSVSGTYFVFQNNSAGVTTSTIAVDTNTHDHFLYGDGTNNGYRVDTETFVTASQANIANATIPCAVTVSGASGTNNVEVTLDKALWAFQQGT